MSEPAPRPVLSDAAAKWYRRAIYAQIVGIIVLSVSFFFCTPPVMLLCFPVGAGLIGLGMLIWAILFFKTL